MSNGELAFVLHAHLPFIRHPEHEFFLEEDWLFEAITETYVPLVLALQRLVRKKVTSRLTLSVSPTLAEMLADPLLQSRYRRYLESRIELSEKELSRTRQIPEFHTLAMMYRRNFWEIYSLFQSHYRSRLLDAFAELQQEGILELITCPGTHPFMPFISREEVRSAQLTVARYSHERHFGKPPRGLWLAECGYEPGMDRLIKKAGFNYFILDAHGLLFGKPCPSHGVYAPVKTPAGIFAFGRDMESSLQVWNSKVGYPGDFDYREFYRDLGFDAPYEYIRPFLHPDGVRRNVGMKYYRVTGGSDLSKRLPYDPQIAAVRALNHASHFLSQRQIQFDRLSSTLKARPLVVSPYDAELFGHWWYEGPIFLEQVLLQADTHWPEIRLVNLSEALDRSPNPFLMQPTASSWGEEGYYKVWLNESNRWIYKHQHWAERVMVELADLFEDVGGSVERGLNQAGRELLLAQSSDWAFHLTYRNSSDYARKRFTEHMVRFRSLQTGLLDNQLSANLLSDLEEKDNLFRTLDYRIFRSAKIK